MPAVNKLTIAALLVVTVSLAGCNSSKKATSAATGTAALPAAAASAAAAIESAAAAASAPAASGPAAAAPAAAGGTAAAGCPLTGAQVSAVMGTTYADPTVTYGICSYLSGNNAFTIQVLKAAGVNDFAGTLATAVQDNGTSTTTAISGVGDKATGVGLEIVVQSGSQIIDIRSADSPGFGSWPKSVALAKLVIAGLH